MNSKILFTIALALTMSFTLNCQQNHTGSATYTSTFFGHSDDFVPFDNIDIAVNAKGEVYVTGSTSNADFPVTTSAYNMKHNGGRDVFIAKFDPELKTLLASTFLGGSGDDEGISIVLNEIGEVYITGTTTSPDFPQNTGEYSGGRDVFIAKFDPGLSEIKSSIITGGEQDDGMNTRLVFGKNGSLYACGQTNSPDFPVSAGGYDNSYNGASDIFILKIDPDLTSITASTFIGGSNMDLGPFLGADRLGNIFVTGTTFSDDFPTTNGVYSETTSGDLEIYISKLDESLETLIASTYLGCSSFDFSYGIAIDNDGSVYIPGHAYKDYPTTEGSYRSEPTFSPNEATLSKLNSDLTELLASTLFGGTGAGMYGDKYFHDIIYDGKDNIIVTGISFADDYPTTPGAFDETYNGDRDIVVSSLDLNLTILRASTFIGGNAWDNNPVLALDNNGNLFVAAYTSSPDFPATTGAYDEIFDGEQNAFILKFSDNLTAGIYPEVLSDAGKGLLEELRIKITNNPDLVNSTDKIERTPLHIAARCGNTEIVSYLISEDAVINLEDADGNTPLHLAAMYDHNETAEILVSNGADVNTPNNRGDTPLHVAARHTAESTFNSLVESGAEIKVSNEDGNTPLHYASLTYGIGIVRSLVEGEAEINVQNNAGNTPLHSAIFSNNNGEVMQYLVSKGADVNIQNAEGISAVHYAIIEVGRGNVNFVLGENADYNLKDHSGKTPLHYAVTTRSPQLVNYLMGNGADPKIKDNDGKLPLDIAREAGLDQIAQILER
ncbi:MAG: hypothetical protein GY863_01725 [bacterium]|nr:hypothetical protein [bacterium]